MKKVFLTIIMLLIPLLAFANGAMQASGTAMAGALSGAAIGAAFGGIGAFFGFIIGGIAGAFKGKSNYDTQVAKYETELATYEANKDTYSTNIQNLEYVNDSLELDLIEQQDTINTANTWLNNYEAHNEEVYGSARIQAEDTLYNAKSNWADIEATMAARGMTTGSAVLLADAQKNRVIDLAGESMTLKVGEGVLGSGLQTTIANLESQYASYTATKTYAEKAMQNTQESIDKNNATIEDYRDAIKDEEEAIKDATDRLNNYTGR